MSVLRGAFCKWPKGLLNAVIYCNTHSTEAPPPPLPPWVSQAWDDGFDRLKEKQCGYAVKLSFEAILFYILAVFNINQQIEGLDLSLKVLPSWSKLLFAWSNIAIFLSNVLFYVNSELLWQFPLQPAFVHRLNSWFTALYCSRGVRPTVKAQRKVKVHRCGHKGKSSKW